MSLQALLAHVAKSSLKATTPVIKPGMTVRVSQKIKEGDKERLQAFEGLVIAVDGGTSINATFTVRKVVEGVGVEKVFPLHGKTTPKIEVVKQAEVRRAKLYYMRGRTGKAARLNETHVTGAVYDDAAKATETPAEAAPAETPAA